MPAFESHVSIEKEQTPVEEQAARSLQDAVIAQTNKAPADKPQASKPADPPECEPGLILIGSPSSGYFCGHD
jgi:hypothetical protein